MDTATGKKLYKSETIRGTKKEAERKRTEVLRALDTGGYVEPEKTTFGEYLVRWLSDYLAPSGRAEWTRRTYTSIIRKHVIPALGCVSLQRLTPAMLQHYYAAKRENGSLGNSWLQKGASLSATTLAHHHAVIHEALEHAVKEGLVARNVSDAADPPRIKRGEMKTWSTEEAQRFLIATRESRSYALFLAAITTGMREAELLGLRWQDIDLVTGSATIQQTLHRAGATPVFGRPKTERSRRQVALLPEFVSALRSHRIGQLAERLAAGSAYRDYGLVFTVPGGAPISPSNLLKREFLPLIEAAKVPKIRFHDLRHTHATMLLADGANPKVVSERLGHASIGITLDTYSHVLPEMQREVVAGLQKRLFASA